MRELLHLTATLAACSIGLASLVVMRGMLRSHGGKMIAALKMEHRP